VVLLIVESESRAHAVGATEAFVRLVGDHAVNDEHGSVRSDRASGVGTRHLLACSEGVHYRGVGRLALIKVNVRDVPQPL
jgi:hypothetical protein